MATGRPDDIGQQFPADANTGSVQNPLEGRAQSNNGVRPTTIEGFFTETSSATTASDTATRTFQVSATTEEHILAYEVTLSDGDIVVSDTVSFIAKPPELRKTIFENTIDDDSFTRTSVTADRRKLERTTSVGILTRYENVTPAYAVGENIYATAIDYSGVSGVTLVDVNAATRRWESDEPEEKYYQITNIDRDTFQCQEWDFVTDAQKVDDVSVLLPAVVVAKPHLLRGSYWDAKSITTVPGITSMAWAADGSTLETDDYLLRTQTPTPGNPEGQEIHPAWWPTTTLIRAKQIPLGTGAARSGAEALWLDLNDNASIFGVSTRHKWFVVVTISRDTFDCQEWDIVNDVAIAGSVLVAKPIELQGSRWHAATIDGVDYTSTDGTGEASSHTTRTATDNLDNTITEEQLIIPKYIGSATLGSKILAMKIATGATRSGSDAEWQDTNQAGRAFAKDANA